MPVLLEPDQKYPIVLEGDIGKDPEPTFFAKAQNMRGQTRIATLVDEWSKPDEGTTVVSLFDAAVELLGDVLTGWKNMIDPVSGQPIEYSVEQLREVLTYNETRQLIRAVMYNTHIDAESKKNFALLRLSETESSAGNAKASA